MNDVPFDCYDTVAQMRGAFAEHPERESGDGSLIFALALRARPGLVAALLDQSFSRPLATSSTGDEVEETVYFRANDPEAFEFLGIGSAVRLRLLSDRPFEEAASYLCAARVIASAELRPFVRFFGGGAFDPRREHDERCWINFGSGTLILPRVLYIQGKCSAAFVVVGTRDELNQSLALLERVLAVDPSVQPALNTALTVLGRRDSVEPDVWSTILGTAQAEMLEGRLAKVVTARRVTYQLSEAPRLSGIIERLKETTTDSTIFALRLGAKVFLGATPETLVSRLDRAVYTEALAGTQAIPRDGCGPDMGGALLSSAKDRREHQFVVEAIHEVLGPLCDRLEVPQVPAVRALRRMIHLHTAITGELHTKVHIVQLVAQLHPTPAVGGVPRDVALDFISVQEPVERGWYAAPFGWCTPEGDGHFVVALRSALLSGDKAHLYAGAGIVRGSDPGLEYEETELKMSSILNALGLAS